MLSVLDDSRQTAWLRGVDDRNADWQDRWIYLKFHGCGSTNEPWTAEALGNWDDRGDESESTIFRRCRSVVAG